MTEDEIRIIGALIWRAGGQIEIPETALMDSYEIKRSDVPERNAILLKARPLDRLARERGKQR